MSLSFIRCDGPSIWDEFVAGSPQGNIFCKTGFLDACMGPYELWFVESNNEPQAGVVIIGSNRPVMYQGLLFSGQCSTLPPHRRSKWDLEVLETLLDGLSRRYHTICLGLHYASGDLRGLQWFHYHEPHLGQFRFELSYTGLVDLTASSDFESYLSSIRKVRRYEYGKALREGLKVEISNDVATLDHLHELTFQRQGLERKGEKEMLRALAPAALAHSFGEILVCRNASGDAVSATLFLYDERCGYYMFGANHPNHRGSGGGTVLLLENIRRCRERGLRWVDMVGINSPNRGDFKTSFNAVPTPYFLAQWERLADGCSTSR